MSKHVIQPTMKTADALAIVAQDIFDNTWSGCETLDCALAAALEMFGLSSSRDVNGVVSAARAQLVSKEN